MCKVPSLKLLVGVGGAGTDITDGSADATGTFATGNVSVPDLFFELDSEIVSCTKAGWNELRYTLREIYGT